MNKYSNEQVLRDEFVHTLYLHMSSFSVLMSVVCSLVTSTTRLLTRTTPSYAGGQCKAGALVQGGHGQTHLHLRHQR